MLYLAKTAALASLFLVTYVVLRYLHPYRNKFPRFVWDDSGFWWGTDALLALDRPSFSLRINHCRLTFKRPIHPRAVWLTISLSNPILTIKNRSAISVETHAILPSSIYSKSFRATLTYLLVFIRYIGHALHFLVWCTMSVIGPYLISHYPLISIKLDNFIVSLEKSRLEINLQTLQSFLHFHFRNHKARHDRTHDNCTISSTKMLESGDNFATVILRFGTLFIRPCTTRQSAEQDTNYDDAIMLLPSGGHINLLHPLTLKIPMLKYTQTKVVINTLNINYDKLAHHQMTLATIPPNSAQQEQKSRSRKSFSLRSFRVVCDTVLVESIMGDDIKSELNIKGATFSADKIHEKENIKYKGEVCSGVIIWHIFSSTRIQPKLELVRIARTQIDASVVLSLKSAYESHENVCAKMFPDLSEDAVAVNMKIKGLTVNVDVNKVDYIAQAFNKKSKHKNSGQASIADDNTGSLYATIRLPKLCLTVELDDSHVNVIPISIDEIDPNTGHPIFMKGELVNKRALLYLSCDYVNRSQLVSDRLSKESRNHTPRINIRTTGKNELVYRINTNIEVDNFRLRHASSEWSSLDNTGKHLELISINHCGIGVTTCLSEVQKQLQSISCIQLGPWTMYHADIIITTKRLRLMPWDSMPATSPLYFWAQFVLTPIMDYRIKNRPVVEKKVIEWPWALDIRIKFDISNTSVACTGTDWAFVGENDVEPGTIHILPIEDKTLRMKCFVENINGSIYTFPKNGLFFESRPRFHSSFGYVPDQSSRVQNKRNLEKLNRTSKSLSDATLRLIIKGTAIKYKFGTIKGDTPATARDKQFAEKLLVWNSQTTLTGELYRQLDKAHEVSVSTVASECGIGYSVDSHYAILLVIAAIKDMRDGKNYQGPPESTVSKTSAYSKTICVQNVQVQLDHIDVRVTLPQNQRLYFRGKYSQVEWCKIDDSSSLINITSKSFNVFCAHPIHINQWSSLVLIEDIHIGADDRVTELDPKAYELNLGYIDIRIPNGFMLSDLISQISLTAKGIKALNFRLSGTGHPFIDILPIEKPTNKTSRPPKLFIVSGPINIQFEDNPLDIQLRHIFTNGLEEQKRRFESEIELDKSIRNKSNHNVDQRQKYWDFYNCQPPFIGSHGEADMAQYSLDKYNELSWIRRIKRSYKEERKTFKESEALKNNGRYSDKNTNLTYGDHPYISSAMFMRLFMINVAPFSKVHSLMRLTIEHFEVQIGCPTFGIDHERSFMTEIGNTPRNKKYASLMSIGLNIKAGKTLIRLRDYPLPLLDLPVSATPDPSDGYIAWSLQGDYIIARELGIKDGISLVSVPVLYAVTTNVNYKFNLLSICSPLKFYSRVHVKILNSTQATIGYGTSYTPAIQDIKGVLEKFSSSSTDPSPKLGIWDKIRFCIHTQADISFVGGGDLCVVLKGLRNPYNLDGLGAGLANIWSNGVIVRIGSNNLEKEAIQITSGAFKLIVPNLISGRFINLQEYHSFYKESTKSLPVSFRLENNSTLPRTSTTSAGANTREISSCLEKTILSLERNVQIGIGCEFERYCIAGCPNCGCGVDDPKNCRLYQFIPHHSIYLKSREAVKELPNNTLYDAYRGFRSDFIHISIRISAGSMKGERTRDSFCNSVYLTPNILDHYSSWKSMFSRFLQLNIRSGSLFPKKDKRKKQKLGKHLSTIKFKIIITNLFVSYIFQGDKINKKKQVGNRENDVGLKIRLGRFYLDAHRGKQDHCDIPSPKLGMPPAKPAWFYYNTEVRLYDVDVRGVRAIYRSKDGLGQDTSDILGRTDQQFTPLFDEFSDQESPEDYMDLEPEYTPPGRWIDPDDFTDLGRIQSEFNPYVNMYPLMFSPCIKLKKVPNKEYISRNGFKTDIHYCIMTGASEADKFQLFTVKESIARMEKLIYNRQVSSKVLNNIHTSDLQRKRDVLIDRLCTLESRLGIEPTYLPVDPNSSSPNSSISSLIITPVDEDTLLPWENYMGAFDTRITVHNPQIIWNEAIKDIVYAFREAETNKRVLKYVLSERSAKLIRECILKVLDIPESENLARPSDEYQESKETPMAIDMLKKLLEDFGVYPSQSNNDSISLETFDDYSSFGPRLQVESIPNGYTMKSDFLVDLLNPQIRVQTKNHPEAGILLTNELIHIKTFTIMDSDNLDVETGLVKRRRLASISDSQLFITHKTVHRVFAQQSQGDRNHYDAFSYSTMAWANLETVLSNSDKLTPGLRRISRKLDMNIQQEEYNPLYVKSNLATLDSNYFDDPCDTLHVNCPTLNLTINSQEYSAFYSVISGIISDIGPSKLELRAVAVSEMIKNISNSSLMTLNENVSNLQERFRFLQAMQAQHKGIDLSVDNRRVKAYNQRQNELEYCFNQLYMTMEVAKSIQYTRQASTKDKLTVQSAISMNIQEVFVELMTNEYKNMFNIRLGNVQGGMLRNELQAVRKSFEVAKVLVEDTSDYAFYTRIVETIPDFVPSLPGIPNQPKLRVCLVSLPQVANMDVIQELAIDMVPLKICLSHKAGKEITSFFFPSENQDQTNGEDLLLDEISGFRVFAETPSIDIQSGGIILPGGLRMSRGEYVDGPLSDSPEPLSDSEPVLRANPGRINGEPMVAHTRSGASAIPVSLHHDLNPVPDVVLEPVPHIFVRVNIQGAKHCINYRGENFRSFYDLTELEFFQPALEYRNQIWTWYEFVSAIKKDMRRAAYGHYMAIILQKTRRHHRNRTSAENSRLSVGSDNGRDSYLSFESEDSNSSRSKSRKSRSIKSSIRSMPTILRTAGGNIKKRIRKSMKPTSQQSQPYIESEEQSIDRSIQASLNEPY
ncbi:RNA pol II promoter Fmp27 protein domain-containing protein [Phycomyces blakesleeanus]|uniref:RNA pol II promoter Fmp27 protein domain-containing protein n=2 Tax=Phycomyces blakesleeanus TaxID=4837 RepID=A0ABR3B7N6_PHYBL